MLKEFNNILQNEVDNHSIYVIGGNGEPATEEFIKEHETGTHRTQALELYRSNLKKGYKNMRAFDCSGIGIFALRKLGLIGKKDDLTANGLYGRCTKIKAIALKPGDWCFKVSNGKATHIGYMVDKMNVIEARGRAYGVVKRDIGSGEWTAYGRPSFFKEEIEKEEMAAYVFKRNLKKGMKGEDVKEYQLLLYKNGFSVGTIDGDFGSKTLSATKAAQKQFKLSVDGVAGAKTITALGGVYGEQPKSKVTICTYNIKRGTYKKGTYKIQGDIIKEADIIGLQEVTPSGLNSIKSYAGKTSYMCSTITNYGHGILTNFATSDEKITTLGGSGERRKVHHMMIGNISFYNTHFHYTESANKVQMSELVALLKKDKHKTIIVTGDFNRQEYSEMISAGFIQTNRGQKIQNTSGGSSIVNKIDQVFVKGATVEKIWKYESVAKQYSDHDALFVTVKI